MSPEIRDFISHILKKISINGDALEVGATPQDTLLNLPQLAHLNHRIGINSDPAVCENEIQWGNANLMPQFEDGKFSLVLCNSVLEHDLYFWRTLSEISRVTSPGGLIVIGVPAFGEMGNWLSPVCHKFLPAFLVKKLYRFLPEGLKASSMTLGLHHFPSDYYRFSKQALKALLLEYCSSVDVYECMQPPRAIVVAYKRT